jgi:hypothetical protein
MDTLKGLVDEGDVARWGLESCEIHQCGGLQRAVVECVVVEGVIWREGRATGDDEHVEVSMLLKLPGKEHCTSMTRISWNGERIVK